MTDATLEEIEHDLAHDYGDPPHCPKQYRDWLSSLIARVRQLQVKLDKRAPMLDECCVEAWLRRVRASRRPCSNSASLSGA